MSLTDVPLKIQYITGADDLLEDFYIPCLARATSYDRAAGFFNSRIYGRIKMGLDQFVLNGGKMRLVTGVELSLEDKEQIAQGYAEREIIEKNMMAMMQEFEDNRDHENIANLCWLIKNAVLDIKVTVPYYSWLEANNDEGIFHDKIGVFTDSEENYVVFFGSNNESTGGWVRNFESFEVYASWDMRVSDRAEARRSYFERLWQGDIYGLKTYDFPEAVRSKLVELAPENYTWNTQPTQNPTVRQRDPVEVEFEPRTCQLDAFKRFLEGDMVCLYQMATGTGKTKAALYSFREVQSRWDALVILVPSLDLLRQWQKDIRLFFFDDYLIVCGSSSPRWKIEVRDYVKAKLPRRAIILSTYDSARSDIMISYLKQIPAERLGMICDEVHTIGSPENRRIMDEITPRMRLGLSATPVRHFDQEGSEQILHYYNDHVFPFLIRDAIREGYLVEYEYHVYPVYLTNDEWDDYIQLSNEISKLGFKNSNDVEQNNSKTSSYQNILLERRASILKRAFAKRGAFARILNNIAPMQRTLIYGDSISHLEEYGEILNNQLKEYFMYVGYVDSARVRPKMLEDFELGIRKYLLAVQCLDEGVDIPCCDTAIFVSSSTSTREFVQRRGRVLRTGSHKSRAYLYDFFVIPLYDLKVNREYSIAKQVVAKEYDRIRIMADDAINGTRTLSGLDKELRKNGLDPFQF